MASKMIDHDLSIQAGVTPYRMAANQLAKATVDTATNKKGVGFKAGGPMSLLKGAIFNNLQKLDEQNAVNRYVWYNLPAGLSSQELERALYYWGDLCFFYDEGLGKFYFMPYALDGSIDYYGRFNHVHPVPMTSGYEEKDTDPEHAKIRRAEKAQAELLSMLKLKCVYDIVPPEEITEETLTKSTVLLHDFTPSRAQKNPRRADMMTPILDSMAEIFPFMKTALISGCGTRGVVSQEGAEDSVKDASRAMHGAALNNEPFVAITSPMELQDLTNGSVYKVEEFALAMQTLDNFRLSLYGIDNGGLFEKKAHELQSEFDLKGSSVGLVMQDGLAQRQNFCNIVNSIWGDPSKPETLIWCMPADNIMGMDSEGDGTLFNNDTDSSQSGSEMPTEEGGNEND